MEISILDKTNMFQIVDMLLILVLYRSMLSLISLLENVVDFYKLTFLALKHRT
jgi:hypothetical protein